MATMVGTQKDIGELLNQLLELDYDAIEAYRAAIERIGDDEAKSKLTEFMGDHERHVQALIPLIRDCGREPSQKADVKAILTKGKVVLGALVGDKAVLAAMKTNEDDTNTAYERATRRTDLPDDMSRTLAKHLDDERRHRAWLEQRLGIGAQQSAHR